MAVTLGGWNDAVAGGWNGGERLIGGVRRIPLQGLTLVNQDPAKNPATPESAAGRAILCVPSSVDAAKPVDVLFHLHGHNVGYRQPTGQNVAGAGTVRDVQVDEIEDQLGRSGRAMIGVLIQGSLTPTFGRSGVTGFDVNTVLEEVLDRAVAAGIWPSTPPVARVVVSGHGGGGSTIAALAGQPGQPRLPRKMAGLFLFSAINAPGELTSITSYLTDRLTYDSFNIQNLDANESDQLNYLRTSPRLRGFYDPRDAVSATNYATLRQSLIAWFARNADDLGGTESAPYKALAANYQILTPASATTSESVIGNNNLVQALSALS
jgi:hypothetical protein